MLGSTLGGYTIKRELGAGGMGTVYLGESDGQTVALKIVHPHLIATPGFFKRFMREAELGRRVEHQNVVRTLDVDLAEADGQMVHYLVMEYVQGKNLRELLFDLGTIPEALLREIALQTTAGLAAIHRCDIVHRDLKPENILITDDHEIRIMDLGVAKLQEASIVITQEGQFAGSLLYAAPEQFRKDGEVGASADLYSLGVLLYELATGQNPFRSDDAAAVISAHLSETPPRLSDRSDDVSLFLTEVVATLLAKRPAGRFESAAALHTVLEEAESSEWWAEHEPVREAALPRIRVNRETKLHGRDKDLARLAEAWASAKAGRGNTVWIEGEAGIGKTRLVDAFLQEVEDAHVLYGSYPPSGGLGGFSDAILGKFGSNRLAGTLRPYLTETPTLVPAFAALVKHEGPPTGIDPLTGDALQAVIVHLMRALAAERPLVWVVDDLHFAAQESRDLVLAMARAVEGHRVLLVATSRGGVGLEDFSRLDNFSKLTPPRLGGRDIVHLLQDAFQSEDLAEKLGGRIALKSDGVPFFIFEMIRGLREGQFIRQRDDGSYVQTRVIDEIEVPSAVKDLIEARLRGLTESQRAMLDVGAVQGMSFDPGLVAAVLEEKRVRVLRVLAEIERRHGLVRGEAGLTHFDQNQIQEVVYSALTPDLRAEYHALIAEAYESDGGDDPVFLAHHHLRGSRPQEALKHLEPALEQLEKSYRNETLLDLANRALDIDGLLAGKERCDVLLRKAGRLDLLGRRDEQHTALDEAVALADETGDAALRGKARVALGWLLVALSQHDAAQDALREAFDLARAAGDRKLEGRVTGTLGHVFRVLGRLAEAREHYERGRALSREIGDRQGEAIATCGLGEVFLHLGRPAEAREHYERGRALTREIGNRQGEGHAIAGLGALAEMEGNADEARRLHGEALALRRELGEKGNMAATLVALGRLEGSASRLDEALALARETENPEATPAATVERARLPGGDAEAALAALAEHEQRVGHAGRLDARFRLWQLTGDAAHLEEARRLLDFLVEHAPEEDRESMPKNVPLHREISEAWGEYGKEGTQ